MTKSAILLEWNDVFFLQKLFNGEIGSKKLADLDKNIFLKFYKCYIKSLKF